ncbi:XRE family transcriptional regulator [Deinococcus rubellus]|uniref:helix-turn-helix domain-containing protein n=1 Tax=Deinococcus rubellus TaxID=1889240 RepID=UPI0031EFCE1A
MKGEAPPTRSRLGERLRALRQARGLTLQQLADASKCSRSFLSMLERGQTDVSATLLQRLAAAFQLSAADLLPDEARTDILKVVRHGEAPRSVQLGPGVQVQVLFTDLLQKIQPVLLSLEPGSEQRNDVGHAGEEFIYVLDGEIQLTVHHSAPRTLRTGDSAYYPSALPHCIGNVASSEARILTMSTPPRLI